MLVLRRVFASKMETFFPIQSTRQLSAFFQLDQKISRHLLSNKSTSTDWDLSHWCQHTLAKIFSPPPQTVNISLYEISLTTTSGEWIRECEMHFPSTAATLPESIFIPLIHRIVHVYLVHSMKQRDKNLNDAILDTDAGWSWEPKAWCRLKRVPFLHEQA